MIEIVLNQAEINIGKNDLGLRAIIAVDVQSGIRVVIPLDEAGARNVARELAVGIVLASKIPDG